MSSKAKRAFQLSDDLPGKNFLILVFIDKYNYLINKIDKANQPQSYISCIGLFTKGWKVLFFLFVSDHAY